jgi:poly(A) polymerase/tRNA nucleotidyltransferase (CCA-adding enzyme)
MVGPNDILIPAGTGWLHDPGAQSVCRALMAQGGRAYFVGGCVRNALMAEPDSDIDIATDLRPDTVITLAKAAGLHAVPTGIDHGTITVVVNGTGYEVTSFRKDVETDGRRAVVVFSDHMEDDARRRDFTINALYATPEGRVIDPLGGLPDIAAKRIRFIEDAEARIREDYLRILRFFRFSAWFADPAHGFDADTLDAISRNAEGLDQLSAERIGAEMIKLLSAPDPTPAVAAMTQCNVLSRVLPGSDNRLLGPVVHLEETLDDDADWVLRLAALGGSEASDRLRLSRKDARALQTLTEAAWGADPVPHIAYRHGQTTARQAAVLRAALAQSPIIVTDLGRIEAAAKAVFPVKAKDLMPRFSGPDLGKTLRQLEDRWIASGFQMSREELLAAL